MGNIFRLLLLIALPYQSFCQPDPLTKTRFTIGISAPELLHAGVNVDLAPFSQLGISAGIGPTMNGVWPTLNAEHRLYFGKPNTISGRKKWFFRVGGTYFTTDGESAATFTFGTDLKSKKSHAGWTIDAGIFILFQKEEDRENQLYPALRFQHYNYFKKKKKQTE